MIYQEQKDIYTIINNIIPALIKSWQSNTGEQRSIVGSSKAYQKWHFRITKFQKTKNGGEGLFQADRTTK